MSNHLFNIRFGKRHFIVTNRYEVSFRVNEYWNNVTYDSWFAAYCLFGKWR